MMIRFRHMSRFLAILLVSVWGALGVVAPVHAAEEDIHHVMNHDGVEEIASNNGQPLEEGTGHPEHATHCHSGACHFHAMSRNTFGPAAVIKTATRHRVAQYDLVEQADLSALFHPPRI